MARHQACFLACLMTLVGWHPVAAQSSSSPGLAPAQLSQPPKEQCSDCCPSNLICVCGGCFDPDGPLPSCPPPSPDFVYTCCDDEGTECNKCNSECCLGDDICRCGGCFDPKGVLPLCPDVFPPRNPCCQNEDVNERCSGPPPLTGPCTDDCCPVDFVCVCGSCFPEDGPLPGCTPPRPGEVLSCCDNVGAECTLCNADCCLGTDRCTCKGKCAAEGDLEPECDDDDYYENGNPKLNCCGPPEGTERCSGTPEDPPPPPPPPPPVEECGDDCCPVGLNCICGSCFGPDDPLPACARPIPGIFYSCCDDKGAPCNKCNNECCLGDDVCSCEGTCISKDKRAPQCNQSDGYLELSTKCCESEDVFERCSGSSK
eukprot:jgi/Ulvmu1/2128/UM127_0013.1